MRITSTAARTAGMTAAVFAAFGVAATPAAAAPVPTAGNTLTIDQFAGAPDGDAGVLLDFCLRVTAQTLNVWDQSTGGKDIGTLFRGEVVHVTDRGGNRYKIDSPMGGWISADPAWTDGVACP